MKRITAVRGALLACATAVGCGAPDRDVIPATHDVVDGNGAVTGVAARSPADSSDGGSGGDAYQHVAKRRHGVVALAEGRGFAVGQAERAVDGLADAFETCATEREREGKLVPGAVRVVVRVNAAGEIDGLNVRAAPGAAVAANVLLCIVAPLKAETFGPGEARGMAIESEWQPQGSASSTTAPRAR